MAKKKEFFCLIDGEQIGPLSPNQLKAMADGEKLTAKDFVWTDTLEDWVPATRIQGLFVQRAKPQTAPEQPPSPAPVTHVPPTEWYVSRDGKQIGPYSHAQLQRMAATGKVAATDFVWSESMADWMPLNSPGLFLVSPESGVPPVPAAAHDSPPAHSPGPIASQQVKVDWAGIAHAAPVALIVAVACGLSWFIPDLGRGAALLGYFAAAFAGLSYVVTARNAAQWVSPLDALVNGAILGAAAVLLFYAVPFCASSAGFQTSFPVSTFGIDILTIEVIVGAFMGQAGAFGFLLCVAPNSES